MAIAIREEIERELKVIDIMSYIRRHNIDMHDFLEEESLLYEFAENTLRAMQEHNETIEEILRNNGYENGIPNISNLFTWSDSPQDHEFWMILEDQFICIQGGNEYKSEFKTIDYTRPLEFYYT